MPADELEYLPAAYQRGKWISLASITLFMLATGYYMRKNRLSVSGETS